MAKRELNKKKKSNIKCEHCQFWDKKDYHCKNMISENYNQKKDYWNRCKQFEWEIEYGNI